MTADDARHWQDKEVMLRLADGETARVMLIFVDAEYEDVIVNILRTDRPELYGGPPNAAYVFPLEDLVSITPAT